MTKASQYNEFVANESSRILFGIRKSNPGITPPVMAALGCGLLYNAVRNHPDYTGASTERITREMIRLLEDFLDTFTPTAVN